MENSTSDLLADVADYYGARLAEHGPTPRGVDWNSREAQVIRFGQLSKVIRRGTFSLNDLGCGYGALLDYLRERWSAFTYTGCDVSPEMVEAARSLNGGDPRARFFVSGALPEAADYGIASGIFNVRLGRSDTEWAGYLRDTLDELHRASRRGFAFNCLTSYSDPDKIRDHLYYADPCEIFDLCKRRYSPQVALLHDYGLYEFTILVSKDP